MLSNILLNLMEGLLALNSVSSKFKWVTYHVLGWSYVFFQVSSATVSQPKTHKRSWYNFLPDSRDSAEAPLISHSGSDWFIYIYIFFFLISVRGYSQVYKHELHIIWNRVTNGIGQLLSFSMKRLISEPELKRQVQPWDEQDSVPDLPRWSKEKPES